MTVSRHLRLSWLISSASLTFICSCTGDRIIQQGSTYASKAYFRSEEVKNRQKQYDGLSGDLIICTHNGSLDKSSRENEQYQVSGALRETDLSRNMAIGDLVIDGLSRLSPNNHHFDGLLELGEIAGKDVEVSVLDPSNQQSLLTHKLHFPEVLAPALPDTLTQGSTITWNADVLNDHGIYLEFQFGQDHKHAFDAPSYKIHAEDDGEYVIQKRDLSLASSDRGVVFVKMYRENTDIQPLNTDLNNMNALTFKSVVHGFRAFAKD